MSSPVLRRAWGWPSICGIAGVWARSNPEGLCAAVGVMTEAMVHRGPDDGGIASVRAGDAHLALGARRLAIQDPTIAAHQPMSDDETGNWIVFNGEISNFRELRAELFSRGARFHSTGDTEVLLRAYAAWGVNAISRLRGMFAFAIWDAKSERLVLARDRLGVKPLYYATSNGTFRFASEVRALLKAGLVDRRLSTEGLSGYLALGGVQDPYTMIEGVHSLPAGHYATWKYGRIEIQEYWSLHDQFRLRGRADPEAPDAGDQVRAALMTAVRLRLISDAPTGVFLSGGLDSATLTALAAQQSEKPIRTVSVVFLERHYSEGPYVELVTRRYGTHHAEVCLSHQDFIGILPRAVEAMDQPTFDGVNTYVVAAQARAAGLTVALSGLGGDELFGGYPSFSRSPALRLLRRWLPSIARQPAAAVLRKTTPDNDQARKFRRWVEARDLDGGPEILSRELFGPADRHQLVPGTLIAGPNGSNGDSLVGLDDFNLASYHELGRYMKNVLLRDTDVMSMAHGLEVREPFLDHELIELVGSLSGKVKQRGGGFKPLLVRAMRNDLPIEILTRSKMGFDFPFREWLLGPLRSSVESVLLDRAQGGQLAALLNPSAVEAVWRRFLDGSATWIRPWSLYVLKQWGAAWL